MLPKEVENMLANYFTFDEDQSCQPKASILSANVISSTQQQDHFFRPFGASRAIKTCFNKHISMP